MTFLLLKAKELWTWFLLLLEEVSLAVWKAAAWVFLFLGLWVFDPFAGVGIWVDYLLAVIFFVGFAYFVWRSTISLPSAHEVKRRLEGDSGVRHRPLEVDTPTDHDGGALWARNQAFLKAQISALRWVRPRAVLAARDPYALRLVAVMFFLCAVWVNGSVWTSKVHDGMFPFMPAWEGAEPIPRVTLWITPPDYTGAKQMILYNGGQDEALAVPAYSQIKAVVRGGFSEPVFRVTTRSDDPITREWAFEKLDNHQYSVEFDLPEDLNGEQVFAIRQSFLGKLSQDVSITPDMPPQIVEKEPVKTMPNSAFKFALTVTDDYGVKNLSLHMRLDPMIDTAPLGAPLTERRVVISPPEEPLDIRPTYDLTHHHWAGLPVVFSFEVADAHGQNAFLGPIYQILPERQFQHPVAQKLISYRKRLIWSPYMDHAEISQEIELILTRPSLFQGDLIAALAMRAAASRLYHTPRFYGDEQLETAKEVVKLLWDTALRVEDGNLSLAARDLKTAREDLQDALQDPETTDQEKAILMQKLKQAMAEYFRELQREMQKRMAGNQQMMMQAPLLSPEEMANMLSSDSLSEFLEKMEQQIMNGEAGDAQEMLSQLEKMMQMMDPNAMQAMPQDMQMMQQGVNELQELIDRQQDLMDQTTQQDAQMQRNVEKALRELYQRRENKMKLPEIDTSANKVEQDALRFVLGQLMLDVAEKLDDVPAAMGEAEMEMRGASYQLEANKPGGALPHQQGAIDLLNQAQDNLSEQLSQRMQQMMSFSMSSGGQEPYAPGGYDPLGRPYDPDGNQDGESQNSDVEVPDEMDRRRVQEIQKILRDRSGEYDRPEAEREYYRRLLKSF